MHPNRDLFDPIKDMFPPKYAAREFAVAAHIATMPKTQNAKDNPMLVQKRKTQSIAGLPMLNKGIRSRCIYWQNNNLNPRSGNWEDWKCYSKRERSR